MMEELYVEQPPEFINYDSPVVPHGTDFWQKATHHRGFMVDKTAWLVKVLLYKDSDGPSRHRRNRGTRSSFARPMGFGKTTLLQMYDCFFSKHFMSDGKYVPVEERQKFFMNTSIGRSDPEFVKKYCGKYAVIYASFKVLEFLFLYVLVVQRRARAFPGRQPKHSSPIGRP